MTENIEKIKINSIYKPIVFSWVVFSICYWICAVYKPFHGDEFFSWIYAARCSFWDIIYIREFGIGHPPLYHLLQKLVQVSLGTANYLNVRLVNYFFGSAFAIIFVNYLLKEKKSVLFAYSVICSAAVLDAFVFSRMYGAVLFIAGLLLIVGEKTAEQEKPGYKIVFTLIFLLGLCADYSFIILLPYFCLNLFKRQTKNKTLILIIAGMLMIFWFFTEYVHARRIHEGIVFCLFNIVYNFSWISYEFVNLIFRFWFQETLVLAVLVYLITLWKNNEEHVLENSNNKILSYFVISAFVLFLCLQLNIVRVRLGVFIFMGLFITALRLFLKPDFDLSNQKTRIITAIFLALLVVLVVSPVFWRELTHSRYLIGLLPLALYHMNISLPKKTLDIAAIILILSGLCYMGSKAVSDEYPPPELNNQAVTIYENPHAFGTQYIKHSDSVKKPLIADMSEFDKFCKIGKVGTDELKLNELNNFLVLGKGFTRTFSFVPKVYILKQKIINLSWWDKFCFKFLTPINKDYYAVYKYSKSGD